jgi:hypothetical protein
VNTKGLPVLNGGSVADQYSPKVFGESLRALREHLRDSSGDLHQYSRAAISKHTGVNEQFIYRLETQEIQKVSYPDVTAYTTVGLGLTPNETATLAGMWDEPIIGRPLRTKPEPAVVGEVRRYLESLTDERDREDFTILLRLIIEVHRRRFEQRTESTPPPNRTAEIPDHLPDWLKRKLCEE